VWRPTERPAVAAAPAPHSRHAHVQNKTTRLAPAGGVQEILGGIEPCSPVTYGFHEANETFNHGCTIINHGDHRRFRRAQVCSAAARLSALPAQRYIVAVIASIVPWHRLDLPLHTMPWQRGHFCAPVSVRIGGAASRRGSSMADRNSRAPIAAAQVVQSAITDAAVPWLRSGHGLGRQR